MDSTDVLFSLGGVRELPASHYTGEADQIFLHPKHTDSMRTWPISILCILRNFLKNIICKSTCSSRISSASSAASHLQIYPLRQNKSCYLNSKPVQNKSLLQQLSNCSNPKLLHLPPGIRVSTRLAHWTSKAPRTPTAPRLPGWHCLLPGSPVVPLNLEGIGTVRCDCHVLLCLQDHSTLQEQAISLLLTHLQANTTKLCTLPAVCGEELP